VLGLLSRATGVKGKGSGNPAYGEDPVIKPPVAFAPLILRHLFIHFRGGNYSLVK